MQVDLRPHVLGEAQPRADGDAVALRPRRQADVLGPQTEGHRAVRQARQRGDARRLLRRQRQPRAADLDGQADVGRDQSSGQQVHFRRADEARHEGIRRPVVQRRRRVDLLDHAVLEHADALAHGHRLDLVVGHVDRRGRLAALAQGAVQLGEPHAHRGAELGVEVGERLVEEEHVGLLHDRPAHRDPLRLSAGQLLRISVQQMLHLQQAGGVTHALVQLRLRRARQLQAEGQVVVDLHVRVQRVVLEHHRDAALLGGQRVDGAVADAQLAASDALQARDHPQQRRLRAARRADEDHELAVPHFQVHPVHGLEAVGVHLLDLVEAQSCHVVNP